MGKSDKGQPTVYPPQLQQPSCSQRSPDASPSMEPLRAEAHSQPTAAQPKPQTMQTPAPTSPPVCIKVTKVVVVFSLIGAMAGAIMMGLGDPEELDDIDDAEDALFLIGVIVLAVSVIALVTSFGFCCYHSKKYKESTARQPSLFAQHTRHAPRSLVDDTQDPRYVQAAAPAGPPMTNPMYIQPPSSIIPPPEYTPMDSAILLQNPYYNRSPMLSMISEQSEDGGGAYEELRLRSSSEEPSAPPPYECLPKA